VFGQQLRQSMNVFVEHDVGGLDGLGTVWHGRTPSRNNGDAGVGKTSTFVGVVRSCRQSSLIMPLAV
jgi:hypothetical protein